MRNIKFRAWDAVDKIMLPVHELKWDGYGWDLRGPEYFELHDGPKGYTHCRNKKTAIPMQYTGQKDKNGKEIYEGDIVEHVGSYHWITKIVWYNTGWYNLGWEEAYNDKKTGERDPAHWQHHILSKHDTIKVIGNIHENPELIREKKEEVKI